MGLLHSDSALNPERRRPFLAAAILAAVAILSEAGTVFTSPEHLNHRNLHIFFNTLGFALSPVIPLAITLTFDKGLLRDRKSTRLNSSHVRISYAVFCLKKKKKPRIETR